LSILSDSTADVVDQKAIWSGVNNSTNFVKVCHQQRRVDLKRHYYQHKLYFVLCNTYAADWNINWHDFRDVLEEEESLFAKMQAYIKQLGPTYRMYNGRLPGQKG